MIGVYGSPAADFPVNEIFEKGLILRGGQAPVHACIDKLLGMVAAGRITAEDIVSHRLPLDDADSKERSIQPRTAAIAIQSKKPDATAAAEGGPISSTYTASSDPSKAR